MWDQGRIHYNSHALWFQPSAYIDEAMIADWLPNVVQTASSNEPLIDITAKINDAADTLSLYIVNLSDEPQQTIINIANFRYKSKAKVWTIGNCALTEANTDKNMYNVIPRITSVNLNGKDAKYTLPKHSYTIITLLKR